MTNPFQKLFRNPKPVVYAILGFVVLLLLFFAINARASEVVFRAGSAIVKGPTPAIGLDLRYPLSGPLQTDYELGLTLIGSSTYRGDNPNQIALHAMLVDGWRAFEMGLGLAYLTNTDVYNGDNVNFRLLVRWRFTDQISLQYEHFSCAGSCEPNIGRDLITAGWRFR